MEHTLTKLFKVIGYEYPGGLRLRTSFRQELKEEYTDCKEKKLIDYCLAVDAVNNKSIIKEKGVYDLLLSYENERGKYNVLEASNIIEKGLKKLKEEDLIEDYEEVGIHEM